MNMTVRIVQRYIDVIMCRSSLQIESVAIFAVGIARKSKIIETDYLPLSLSSLVLSSSPQASDSPDSYRVERRKSRGE